MIVLAAVVIALVLGDPTVLRAAVSSQASEHFQHGVDLSHHSEDLSKAADELKIARNLDPQSEEVALALGLVESRLGSLDEAAEALQAAIQLNPRSQGATYALAMVYEKRREWRKARECWKNFMPLSQDAELLKTAQKHLSVCESRLAQGQ